MPRYGTIDFDYAGRIASCPPDEDGPVLMVNYMKYRERAAYKDGSDGGRSGMEADDEYAPTEVLSDIGAVVAFFGDVTDPAGTGWDRIGIVQYPTRRAFIDMQSRRDFREKHQHKEAGMDHTIVFAVPPHTVAAGAIGGRHAHVVFDLVHLDGTTGATETTGAAAGPADGQAIGPVEGTILGDGRSWTELRITWITDPDAAPGELDTSESVADRERVVVRPKIDRLATLIQQATGSPTAETEG
ncbi:MAG: hypothetical protein NTZ21_09070 [Actinobacteria bacterium]|nr:hypothetical protein [Actinomycetota bacterium]